MDGLLPLTTFLSSIPYFWLGLVAIAVLTGPDSFFPSSGGYSPGLVPGLDPGFLGNALHHSLLPAATILVTSMSHWIMGMRNMMVTVAAEDYITVAHAKGLPERRVALSYAARNALLPNISGFALSLGFIVGGTLLVEIVFSYPGLGYQLFQAVQSKDYPLMQGIFLIITISVLVANLLADVAIYCWIPAPARRAEMAARRRFRFVANPKAATGLVILTVYLVLAVIGPWIAPSTRTRAATTFSRAPPGGTGSAPPIWARTSSARSWSAPAGDGGRTGRRTGRHRPVGPGRRHRRLSGRHRREILSMLSNVFLVIPALPWSSSSPRSRTPGTWSWPW